MEPITVVLSGARGGSKLKDPSNSNQYEVTCLVPAEEIGKYIATGPYANVREGCSNDPDANKKSNSVVTAIKNQLTDGPDDFNKKNNGIVLFADEASMDAHGKTGTLEIQYSNKTFLREYQEDRNNKQQVRGLGNGGTTAGAIAEAMSEGTYPNSKGTAFVRVTVRCGDYGRSAITDMAEGLNKNLQVGGFSVANYRGEFEEIKKFLSTAQFAGMDFPPVAYYYGAAGEYDIEQLIQMLVLFARQDEKTGDPNPAAAYGGTMNCLNYFTSSEGKRACLKYLPLLPQIVWLYEYIQANARAAYNKSGSFGSLSLFQDAEIAPKSLPFSHLTTDVKTNNGWIFPILAAFIPNVTDNKKAWIVNPHELFLRLAPKLIKALNDQYTNLGGAQSSKISALGRTPIVYDALRGTVETAVLRSTRN